MLDVFQKVEQKERVKKMKKLLALIVACVAGVSVFAGPTYNSSYFVNTKSETPPYDVVRGYTPVFMRGTWKPTTWEMDYVDGPKLEDCNLVKGKGSMDVFLVFCQPCIMCIEKCEEELELTNAYLYIVEKDTRAKIADITVYPLNGQKITVTTGDDLMAATKGEVLASISGTNQNTFGSISNIPLFGVWNKKTWFSGYDTATKANHAVKLSTVQKLDGTVNTAQNASFNKLWTCGTLSLRRDDSLTKTLMLKMTVDTKQSSQSSPFEDCEVVTPTLKNCQTVMTETAGVDFIEEQILKKAGISKWTDVDWHK